MIHLPTQAEQALVSSHQIAVSCDAWYGNQLLMRGFPLVDGTVTNDSTAFVRRTVSLTAQEETGSTDLRDVLDHDGVELRIRKGVRYADGSVDVLPVFCGQVGSFDASSPDGKISITASDRGARVGFDNFTRGPRTSTSGLSMRAQLQTLVTESIPFVNYVDTTRDSSALPQVVWDWSRSDAVAELALAMGAESFAGPDGGWVTRPVQTLRGAPAWTFRDGTALIDSTRTATAANLRNAFRVTSDRGDGGGSFSGYWEDRLSATGVQSPLGRRAGKWSTSTLVSNAQCVDAAKALVARISGARLGLTFTGMVHPGLETGDLIRVVDGYDRYDVILDKYTMDLFSAKMTCTARQLVLPGVE